MSENIYLICQLRTSFTKTTYHFHFADGVGFFKWTCCKIINAENAASYDMHQKQNPKEKTLISDLFKKEINDGIT